MIKATLAATALESRKTQKNRKQAREDQKRRKESLERQAERKKGENHKTLESPQRLARELLNVSTEFL